MKLTYHAQVERLERIVYLATEVDFGNVVLEKFNPETGHRECLTSTGIILITPPAEDLLITAYMADIHKVTALYRKAGYERIPSAVYNKVVKNKIHVLLQNMTEEERKKYLRKNKKRG